MLLFYPVPRSTFLHYLLGTGFSSLIKYHRWGKRGRLLSVIYPFVFSCDCCSRQLVNRQVTRQTPSCIVRPATAVLVGVRY